MYPIMFNLEMRGSVVILFGYSNDDYGTELMHTRCALQGSIWGYDEKIRTLNRIYSLALQPTVFPKLFISGARSSSGPV